MIIMETKVKACSCLQLYPLPAGSCPLQTLYIRKPLIILSCQDQEITETRFVNCFSGEIKIKYVALVVVSIVIISNVQSEQI